MISTLPDHFVCVLFSCLPVYYYAIQYNLIPHEEEQWAIPIWTLWCYIWYRNQIFDYSVYIKLKNIKFIMYDTRSVGPVEADPGGYYRGSEPELGDIRFGLRPAGRNEVQTTGHIETYQLGPCMVTHVKLTNREGEYPLTSHNQGPLARTAMAR